MELNQPIYHSLESYSHFRSHLRRASDRSAIFLTDLAGRTVKKSPSPEGPGFESRRGQQKCHRSITCSRDNHYDQVS